MRQITDEPVIVAGHSLGAAVAVVGSISPAIKALALFSPAGLCRMRVTARLIATSMRWQTISTAASTTGLIRYMQYGDTPIAPELVEWLTLVGRHTKQPGIVPPHPTAELAKWSGKISIATGVSDRFFPPGRLKKPAADLEASLTAVKSSGHLLPDEQPTEIRNLLVELAAKVD